MHPRSAVLMAFCDAEADAGPSGRIAHHLQKCERCRNELQRIQDEKDNFSNFDGSVDGTVDGSVPATDATRGLAAVLAAIAAWKDGRLGGLAPRVRNRVRDQLEMYFGSEAASLMDRPGIRADQLLARTLELADAFLGRNAADALRDDVLRGLDCAGLNTETCR